MMKDLSNYTGLDIPEKSTLGSRLWILLSVLHIFFTLALVAVCVQQFITIRENHHNMQEQIQLLDNEYKTEMGSLKSEILKDCLTKCSLPVSSAAPSVNYRRLEKRSVSEPLKVQVYRSYTIWGQDRCPVGEPATGASGIISGLYQAANSGRQQGGEPMCISTSNDVSLYSANFHGMQIWPVPFDLKGYDSSFSGLRPGECKPLRCMECIAEAAEVVTLVGRNTCPSQLHEVYSGILTSGSDSDHTMNRLCINSPALMKSDAQSMYSSQRHPMKPVRSASTDVFSQNNRVVPCVVCMKKHHVTYNRQALIGPTGRTGSNGLKGESGVRGPLGATGSTGSTGSSGSNGLKGESGAYGK